MIDYYAHSITFDETRKALAASLLTDPALIASRNQLGADLAAASNHAMLGAMVDQLFTHAVSDGTELGLLNRAADLWNNGVDLYNTLASVRTRLESALANPSDPASPAAFNSAAVDAQNFAQSAHVLQTQVISLRDDTLPLAYLAAHPRQSDQPSPAWDWANRLLGRRTDAFVRSLKKQAHNAATRAFAFGALTGYAANAAGSAYLGAMVGGPRRSHRFRDRLGRNSIGTWLARAYPATPSPGKLAQRLRFGPASSPALPSAIANLLQKAVQDTFDLSKTPAPPDFRLGYRRMLDHLTLLDNFVQPPPPVPPPALWMSKLYGDPSNPPPSLRIQDIGPSGDPGGGVSVGTNSPGDTQPGGSDNSSSSTICGIIMLILIIIDVIQAFIQCLGQLGGGKTCTFWDDMLLKKLWEKDPPDPRDSPPTTDPTASSSSLTAMSSMDQITQMIGCLFDIHNQLWEALDRAGHFLAFHGLIYPGTRIDLPVYSQFTTFKQATQQWPRRPVTDPINWYHVYPFSPIENPSTTTAGFADGARPDAFIPLAVNRFAIPLWDQLARGETDTQNLDLDADRGFVHPCWATGGSINDDPVKVNILVYGAQ